MSNDLCAAVAVARLGGDDSGTSDRSAALRAVAVTWERTLRSFLAASKTGATTRGNHGHSGAQRDVVVMRSPLE